MAAALRSLMLAPALPFALGGCGPLDEPNQGDGGAGSSEGEGPFSGWEPLPSCGDASGVTQTAANVDGQAGGQPLVLDCVPAGQSFHYFSATGVAPRPQAAIFCQEYGGGPGVFIAWNEDALVCGTTACGAGVNINVTPETDSIPVTVSCARADEITDASVTLGAIDFGDGSELAMMGEYRAAFAAGGAAIDVAGTFTFRAHCSESCDPPESPDTCNEVCPD